VSHSTGAISMTVKRQEHEVHRLAIMIVGPTASESTDCGTFSVRVIV
jgi:hypothetical protein